MTCVITTAIGNVVHQVRLSDSTLDKVAEALRIPKRKFQSSETHSIYIYRHPKKASGGPPSPPGGRRRE
jgi:hypothetical protein